MAYTTINKSTEHFNTVTYSNAGDGAKAVTGVGFQPDFTWLKARGAAYHHQLFDAVRGATSGTLYSSNNDAVDTGYPLSSFDSDGFTTGAQSSNAGQNSASHVAWNWKAGTGAGSANTDGSINSTVSVNTTAGFSIVSYTGNSTSGATVGHGLGSVPKVVMVKTRSGTGNWINYHSSVGNTKYLSLNQTNSAGTTNQAWNDTSPTNQVFSLGNSSEVNGNGTTMIAYCFAEKTGYSKFGSYTGNGQSGNSAPFIYTGFKPAFVMIKRTDSTGSWYMLDNKRNTFNVVTKYLKANESTADSTIDFLDFTSNGFKMISTGADVNSSGASHIYMAFAEAPLVGSNNVPCTAR